ncbi:Pr6Pr family membrane protein [Phreatobacter sp.]|uniref:Pr6Pr family membrane protein n=1 Tax=Phreatobacter sp. TaxID=1966341 RepID=UPI003F72EB4B
MDIIGRTGRIAAGLVAVTGWMALAIQLPLTIANGWAAGRSTAGSLVIFFSFFTVLTNLLVAVVMTRLASGSRVSASLAGATTLNIAVVGLVYSAVLRAIWNPVGWQKVADHLLHDVVPVLAVLVWLAFVPKGRLSARDLPVWLIYPFAFLGLSLVRGSFDGWYPYPFLDVGRLGLGVVLRNALVVTVLFLGLAALMVALDRWLGRRTAP